MVMTTQMHGSRVAQAEMRMVEAVQAKLKGRVVFGIGDIGGVFSQLRFEIR